MLAVDETVDFSPFRWLNRLLILLGKPPSPELSEAFAAKGAAMAERHLLIFDFTERDWPELPLASTSAQLLSRQKLDLSRNQAVLIGKDGGVKMVWSDPISLEPVFVAIDRMPMRQQEMKDSLR